MIESALIESIPFIVSSMYKKHGDKLLDVLYESFKCDVELSFGSEFIFLFVNDKVFNKDIVIDMNNNTPRGIVYSIIDIIKSRQMAENIRDGNNKIIFRGFKGNNSLNDKDYKFRDKLWIEACGYIHEKEGFLMVWRYLYLKYINLGIVDFTKEENLPSVLESLRVKNVLLAIQSHFDSFNFTGKPSLM